MKKYVIFFISLFLITGCDSNNKITNKVLTCSKDISSNEIKMIEKSDMNFVNDKLETIDININVTLPDNYKTYMDTFIKSFNEQYGKLYEGNSHINYSVNKKNDSEIVVSVNVDYKNMTEEERKASNFSGSEDFEINKNQLINSGFDCK